MAIQPIDLQALFSQVDRLGKQQMLQQEGVQIQAALQSMQEEARNQVRNRSVNEAQDAGEGAEKVKDRNSRPRRQARGKTPQEDDEEDETPTRDTEQPQTWESYLGKNIDLSG